MKHILLSLATMAIVASCSTNKLQYPEAPADNTVDDYFGVQVADPYRPLENDTSAATLKWVEEERALTESYLSKIPFRKDIRERLKTLYDYKKPGMPSKKDGWYYFYENDGLQNQSVLYRTRSLDEKPEVFLDPNKLSDDGTVALTGISTSNDGKYTAYTISRSGSDWTEIYVMDTETKELLPDHIEWAKFTDAAWQGDGFYYSAYDKPVDGKEFSHANENHRVYYHKIGTPQSDDKLVYEDKDHPLHFHSASVPDDESALIIYGGGEGLGSSITMKSLKDPNAKWVTVEPSQDYDISILDIIDGTMYIYTNYGAPRYRLMTASVKAPQRENWKELVPEGEGVLSGVNFAGDKLILTYDIDASNRLYVYSLDGKQLSEIELPTLGSAGVSSSRKHDEVFYTFTSFTYPSEIYKYDLASGKSEPYKAVEIPGFNMDDYVTEQVFYTSADGTKIPMFITYKKGLERNGKNPVYLYGYGGFNVSLNPGFSAQRLFWLENGGIYAEANLRGGGEYGEPWHLAGTKQQKMNVFNDFIAAAEYMIKEGWTSPDYLTIEGGSNGGLLVGATMNLRPDLFKVAIPRVGVMDMMRYHLFTIGWNWASDYGTSADSPEMAGYLLSYSPLHNIKDDGTPYPATLVTTADHDDRVVPAHSFKYAAKLQASNTGDAPKLIRIDSKAGHGAGKPVAKVLDEYADIYSFIFYNLGITPVTK
ncbi:MULTISPECIES: prolyl oligopeptidase family protein [Muribaculum]|uniref:prolyl oligopeptidase n=22 Tax=Muribaculum TaxID=1918540 RepID=A0A4P7VCI0_9BACT|nr:MULTISPECIES: prolyl oligopeptidase family serine peptidase [Muribaculum]QCD34943.1 S9 family peptidase [Muribaculum gordoncarteri]ROT14243.1 S9 family peptidase [Muribaculaceae bacterium Isolate-102 (HZI)]TGY03374.1 S9 family peptidase [Muribaculum sp. NM65_B17]THG42777.1 S9 family peptidase [Muribaculaceae bacterium]